MKHLINVLCSMFIFYLNSINAQVVIDDSTHEPIAYVQIVSNANNIFLQTNLNGKFNINDIIKRLNDHDTILFSHISYNPFFIAKQELIKIDTIKLHEKIITLGEFIVKANHNFKYQKINFCYRSLQLNDNAPAYYIDGKAEFLTKINKEQYNLKLKEYRVFENETIEEDKKERAIQVDFKPIISLPPTEFFPKDYAEKNGLQLKKLSQNKIEILNKENRVGLIEINSHYIIVNIESMDKGKTRNGLNSEVRINKFEVTMLFQNDIVNAYDEDSLEFELEDLIYSKKIREIDTKHKKDNKYTNIQTIEELFVEGVSHYDNVNLNDFKDKRNNNHSQYQTNFWETCDCKYYHLPDQKFLNCLSEK